MPGWTLANSSMSWSPDGRDLLMYQSRTGTFAIVAADQLTVTPLRAAGDDSTGPRLDR